MIISPIRNPPNVTVIRWYGVQDILLPDEKVTPELEHAIASKLFEIELQSGVVISTLVLPRRIVGVPEAETIGLTEPIYRSSVSLPPPFTEIRRTYRKLLPNAFQDFGAHFHTAYLCIVNQLRWRDGWRCALWHIDTHSCLDNLNTM